MVSIDTEIIIREYDPDGDEDGVRACFVALQDHEHNFAPEAPIGAELVDQYVPFMLSRIAELRGRLIVAESACRIVGFAGVVIRQREEPDDIDAYFVEVTELSVLPEARNRGVGGRLLQDSEEFARTVGAPSLRVRVDARNTGARQLYKRHYFGESVILLTKRLKD